MKQVSDRSILIVLVGSILFALLGCDGPNAGAAASSGALEVVIDATELTAAFEKSPERAAELYSGKRARISGYFSRLEPLDNGQTAIVFKTSLDTYRPLRCVSSDDPPDRITELDPGSPITVDGTIAGFTDSGYFVMVENCSVR